MNGNPNMAADDIETIIGNMGSKEMAEKAEEAKGMETPEELPILPIRESVLYPKMILPFMVSQERLVRLVDAALVSNKMIGIVAIKNKETTDVKPADLHQVGCAAYILKMLKMPNNSLRLLIQGISRIQLTQFTQEEPYLRAKVTTLQDYGEKTTETQALMVGVKGIFQKFVEMAPNLPAELAIMAMNLDEPGVLADLIASTLNIPLEDKQAILETLEVKERLAKVNVLLNKELSMMELGSKIQSEVREGIDKTQREYFLREQLKAIQKELGEKDERTVEIEELRQRLIQAKLPPEAMKEAERELDRLAKMPPAAAEYTVARTYLDWLVDLPWAVSTEDNLDISQAQKVLDEDHYDLEKVKKRILEYLAVRKLKADMKGPILCFVGPPGTGKTSLGRSIARALGRKFIRMSLGGVRDEAEVRGHRRTYVGALPGRIIQGIRKAGSNNPVYMLDEIDKLGMDFRGDPSAALLEVLDPEQNNTFSDHYLNVPFDLSKVMFITTANILDPIPPALRDRMEVLDLPGYTEEEKLRIAKDYLVPRQIQAHGLSQENIKFEDPALRRITLEYTREAGVRNLEREIANICRGVARKVAEGQKGLTIVDAESVPSYLGPEKFFSEVAERTSEPGVATGLAWTPTGGDILFIEATRMKGRKGFSLTGQLGEVMKESAQAALSYVRAKARNLKVPENFFDSSDIHIHVPAGAIPKDGPSAGVTIFTAITSLLTGRPVRSDVAMTGEITLRGLVLPVGGIKEKVLAARRAGITTVILPKRNEKDLQEVPEQIKKDMKFHFVQRMDEVIQIALKPQPNSKANPKPGSRK
ncbi:MAG TPA: endopeptidase La [Thermodesulfobacteriota bacterium]|nr:endopeptidase La [Thermodesulfobacteriota bacterium]